MVQGRSIITEEMRKALRIGEEYAKQQGPFEALIAPPTFYIVMDPVETKESSRLLKDCS